MGFSAEPRRAMLARPDEGVRAYANFSLYCRTNFRMVPL